MSEATGAPALEAIDEVLRSVLDPCSCMTSQPTSIVDLGLVEDVAVEAGIASIELVLTSPSCGYYPHIRDEIVEKIVGCDDVSVDEVVVTQNTQTVWDRERMTAAERERREERFERQAAEEGLTPQWSPAEEPDDEPS